MLCCSIPLLFKDDKQGIQLNKIQEETLKEGGNVILQVKREPQRVWVYLSGVRWGRCLTFEAMRSGRSCLFAYAKSKWERHHSASQSLNELLFLITLTYFPINLFYLKGQIHFNIIISLW